MSSTRHERVSELFAEARRLAPDLRAAFLARTCGEDDALRREVESLLAELSASETALDPSAYAREIGALAAGVAGTSGTEGVEEGPGTTVGRYRLLQEIGEGGFGRVYVAEQTEPVVRRVALKIIKLGMDTKQVIARFEAERQALAMMDHPSIAKVLDAGATGTGRPYFVMELVRGVPITEYCDANRLDTRQRIELFMEVCAAVQHAHQKGIIHRDLKPSNVMVELRDGNPVAKVIDFGIAKAMNQKLTEKTIFTEYRQFVGTPQYTSPEQAEMSGLDIDTRSDVYALGVLLYELMTGATPFGQERLRSAGFGEIQRIIREEDPAKPSTRVTTTDAPAKPETETQPVDEVARLRRTDPATLRRTLRGDLDWIVMKAMEKDRTRRYDTASDLGHDLRRHIEHKPVLAGPPSAAYRFRKFARRNRTGLGIVVAAGLALTAGLAVAAVGFYQASQERDAAQDAKTEATAARDESEAVTSFLSEMLAAVDPRNEGDDVTVRAVLDAAGGSGCRASSPTGRWWPRGSGTRSA